MEAFADGETGFSRASERNSALVILNAMLPGKNGFQVCCKLRRAGVDPAILRLTGRALVMDRVAARKLGADDCLASPFDPAEFLARVAALAIDSWQHDVQDNGIVGIILGFCTA